MLYIGGAWGGAVNDTRHLVGVGGCEKGEGGGAMGTGRKPVSSSCCCKQELGIQHTQLLPSHTLLLLLPCHAVACRAVSRSLRVLSTCTARTASQQTSGGAHCKRPLSWPLPHLKCTHLNSLSLPIPHQIVIKAKQHSTQNTGPVHQHLTHTLPSPLHPPRLPPCPPPPVLQHLTPSFPPPLPLLPCPPLPLPPPPTHTQGVPGSP